MPMAVISRAPRPVDRICHALFLIFHFLSLPDSSSSALVKESRDGESGKGDLSPYPIPITA